MEIMVLILGSIITRIIFFIVIFIPQGSRFEYNLFTDNMSVIFKILTVVYYCKYKLNAYYIATLRRAKAYVRILFFILEVYTVVTYIGIGAAYCSAMDAESWLLVEMTPQLIEVIFLIFFSYCLVMHLASKMSFGEL